MDNISEYVPILKFMDSVNAPVGASTLCDIPSLNLSQATIGRKLAELEKAGLLQKVSNKGRILTEAGQNTLRKLDENNAKTMLARELADLSLSDNQEALIDIMETRQLIEPFAAYHAATKASRAEIEYIENIAFVHRYMLSQEKPANKEDLSFHLAITKACGNKALIKILEILLRDHDAYIAFSKVSDDHREQQVKHHFNILNSIKNRDAKAAKKAMQEHLTTVYSSVLESFGKSRTER